MINWRLLHHHLLIKKHRQLVLLVGDNEWASKELEKQISECAFLADEIAIYDEEKFLIKNQYALVDNKNYHHYLGREYQQFIYFGEEIIPDVFAAMAGTIVAGGFIFLVMNKPKLNELIGNNENLYFQRFYQLLIADKKIFIVEQQRELNQAKVGHQNREINNLPLTTCLDGNKENERTPLAYHCVSAEQKLAVEAIIHVVTGHRNRPVVLTADRGRGKSAALALACIHLLKKQKRKLNIVIVAPKLSSLNSFFSQFSSFFSEAIIGKSSVNYQGSVVHFLPIDVVLSQKPKVNLLIVDEAASIPLYLLSELFTSYHRLVFSSTLHGYEGAGRGFAIKFNDILKNHHQQAKEISLIEPIRWAQTDSVEQIVLKTCLLNAELPTINNKKIDTNKLTYRVLNKVELITNEALLRDVFAILVTAHYQTTPNDLKLMLDNPEISIVALLVGDEVIAVSLIITEGCLPQQIADELRRGKRRIRDHFIPQALLVHAGFTHAFNYSYWRIMRIAVHPQLQQMGIGQYFLTQIEKSAVNNKIDVLATSFALNEKLLGFWQKQLWKMARIGFQTDHASGEYSAILLKALNSKTSLFCEQVVAEFYRSYTFLLINHFEKISTLLVQQILRAIPENCKPVLSDFDVKTVSDFAEGYRLFDNCSFSLSLWLIHVCSHKNNQLLRPLIARLLQKKTVEQVCLEYQFSGKKAFQLECRKRVKTILEQ